MKTNKHIVHLNIANEIAKLSSAERRKVGSVLVTSDGRIAGTGYNGTPAGVDNSCEQDDVTHDFVIHAEVNAILNARTNELEDSTMYISLSPCIRCSAMMLQKRIKRVVYDEPYRDLSGAEFLKMHGVEVLSRNEIDDQINIPDDDNVVCLDEIILPHPWNLRT